MATALNHDRFLKVLALAESSNDHEALAAVRRATTMARTSGLSLGEAVGVGKADSGKGHDWLSGFAAGARLANLTEIEKARKAGFDAGKEAARTLAEVEIAALKGRRDRNEHYKRGHQEGRNAERADADARVIAAQAATEQDAYRAGYAKGQADAEPAVTRAYSRGLADGTASVDQYARPKRRAQS